MGAGHFWNFVFFATKVLCGAIFMLINEIIVAIF